MIGVPSEKRLHERQLRGKRGIQDLPTGCFVVRVMFFHAIKTVQQMFDLFESPVTNLVMFGGEGQIRP